MVRVLSPMALVGCLCVFSPGDVTGSGCGSVSYSSSYAQQYVQPVYQQQAAYQTYVPVYKAVVTPDYYYGTQDYYRENLLTDAIAGKLYQMMQQNQTYQQQQYQQAPQYAQPQPQQQYQQQRQYSYQSQQRQYQQPAQQQQPCPDCLPQQQVPNQQQQMPGVPQQQQVPQVNYGPVPNGLQKVADQKCVFCHDGAQQIDEPKQYQRLDLRNLESIDPATRWYAFGHVKAHTMPKRRAALPKEEEDMFLQWALSAGAVTP